MADKLLSRLRREEFGRAHIGLARINGGGRSRVEGLLAAAWQALALARKRGPFARCSADGERLFAPLATGDCARLNRLWRGRKSFALLHIRQDQVAVSNYFSKRVRAALPPNFPVIFLNQREILVYLDGADEAIARSWLADCRKWLCGSGGCGFSSVIAIYPFLNFPKSQIPLNCRKGLLHAELLGPDSVAVFNGTSLNISGDAYYHEGDIRRAVADYRRGLAIDPVNVNLLNSLGVALVQLKRTRPALKVFEKAWKLAPDNFMTLANLGHAHLSAGRDEPAMEFFQRALAVNGCSGDLLLQLGKLYYQRRRYSEAAKLLDRCVADPKLGAWRNADLAAAHRLSGRVLMAQRQHGPAMAALEKALALAPRNPEALSLLGELYLLNGEGDEIALSLCRQAVNLNGERGGNWRRLGWVQWRLGRLDEAVVALRRALGLERRDYRAASWLGAIYQQRGRSRLARQMRFRAKRWQPPGESLDEVTGDRCQLPVISGR